MAENDVELVGRVSGQKLAEEKLRHADVTFLYDGEGRRHRMYPVTAHEILDQQSSVTEPEAVRDLDPEKAKARAKALKAAITRKANAEAAAEAAEAEGGEASKKNKGGKSN